MTKHIYQMRGGFYFGRTFTADPSDRSEYNALPWKRKLRYHLPFRNKKGFEGFAYDKYGESIYGSAYH